MGSGTNLKFEYCFLNFFIASSLFVTKNNVILQTYNPVDQPKRKMPQWS